MKRMKIFLTITALAVMCNAYNAGAQIYVTVRPPVPHYVRVEAPSPRHVWIDEDWVERNGRYEWNGGHWVEPPHPGMMWVPGHWVNRRRGMVWIPGHWRR